MRKFTDTQGRDWHVEIDIPAAKRLRKHGIDLLDVAGGVLDRLQTDPIALVDALWLLCEPTARERGVDEESFARAISGDAIGDAQEALLEGIVDFFPERQRGPMRQSLAAQREVRDRVLKVVSQELTGEALTALGDQAEADARATLHRPMTRGDQSQKPQPSSEPTCEASPSES